MKPSCPIQMLTPFMLEHLIILTMIMPSKHFWLASMSSVRNLLPCIWKEFEELIKLAQEKELLLIEAIINQYLENFKVIKDSLSEIGDIKIVNINYSQYSSRYDAFKQGEIAPAFNPEMGGGAA